MPRRTDIETIMLIGSGPIVIGQACEFDYSGTQACRALKKEGYRVVLLNSNPATIMTDPEVADATYVEPVTREIAERIIEVERPDAILPTMGGQTALNCALELVHSGVIARTGTELIGARAEAIEKAEDRLLFRKAMERIGIDTPPSKLVSHVREALEFADHIGFPVVLRPSFTLGGTGSGIAWNRDEFEEVCTRGLRDSPTSRVLVEKSLLGWKEFEMEVIRDRSDNCIIVCSIENLDPMGVHTGDSITVAPALTLTDKEYQRMRDYSIRILREIGVDTGGSNVQFAVNPADGNMQVIEMNPRVSRSSALASKATGFPIAKVAALLAVGYTLDELRNDITQGRMPASFEPTLDYIVTKVPRFAFEKFPEESGDLTTQMKSVGEAMGIGRSFAEALQKALRSLENDLNGLTSISADADEIRSELSRPSEKRILHIGDAFRIGLDIEQVYAASMVDRWFLAEIKRIVDMERAIKSRPLHEIGKDELFGLKSAGFSDAQLAEVVGCTENEVRMRRHDLEVRPVYKRIDTCAAEFPTKTAYMYSTYDSECEARVEDVRKLLVLGGGPNRIGQGIEFDYCCVHAIERLRAAGFQVIMANCNPETVSTDYDISDRLYFEPITVEDVHEIIVKEQPEGVIVQFGGQTPLNISRRIERLGARIIGTSVDAIERSEDRDRFRSFIQACELLQPANAVVHSPEEAGKVGDQIGYPLIARPSNVLGGRAMKIIHDGAALARHFGTISIEAFSEGILLDRFLENAIEFDVDAVSDGKCTTIAGVMQHIEAAGVHSGDSACSLPPYSMSRAIVGQLEEQTRLIADRLGVVGLLNVQFAVQDKQVYVLEVNPRASRSVPYVSKAIGMPIAKIAAMCMAGSTLQKEGFTQSGRPQYFSVKESVFPFGKFQNADTILGPEMKSTGEAMGIGESFPDAFLKALMATNSMPTKGGVLFSVKDEDKESASAIAASLAALGFTLYATKGTHSFLCERGVESRLINKVRQGHPHVVDAIKNRKIQAIINTVSSVEQQIADSYSIRRAALQQGASYFTTIEGAHAASQAAALLTGSNNGFHVRPLQEWHASLRER